MRHYGPEPPWQGRTRYGWWEQEDPLWDGTPVWRYKAPGPYVPFYTTAARLMKDMYFGPLQRALEQETLLLKRHTGAP